MSRMTRRLNRFDNLITIFLYGVFGILCVQEDSASVFIAPSIITCPEGHQRDSVNHQCLPSFGLDLEAQKDFLLERDKLQAASSSSDGPVNIYQYNNISTLKIENEFQ